MSTGVTRWIVLVAALVVWPCVVAGKGALDDPQQRAALVWQELAVGYPVRMDAAGWPIAEEIGARAGAVWVGPQAGVRVHLASLAVARVRVLGDARPVFHRLTATARVAEAPQELSQGTWLLEQPPGEASDWLVTAEAPVQVVIEGVRARTGDLIWEHAIGSVLAWIDAGGPLPPLPEVPEAERTAQALLADEEIAIALRRERDTDTALRAAVQAWRRAAAIQRLTAMRTPIRGPFGLELKPRRLEQADEIAVAGAAGWQRVQGHETHVLALRGPGVLWVEGRAVGEGGEIKVTAEGRALAATKLRSPAVAIAEVVQGTGPAGQVQVAGGTGPEGQDRVALGTGPEGQAAGAEGTADRRGDGGRTGEDVDLGGESAAAGRADLGVAARLAAVIGAPVGPPGVVRVALAPGLHELRVEFTGPDTLVNVRSGRTNLRLAAALRGEGVGTQLRRGRRALRRSTSPRTPFVAALLASVAGERVEEVGRADGSPTLALAQAELLAMSAELTPAQQHEAARTLARRAARAPVGSLVWRARQRGLELAGEDAALVRALGGSRPAEAPTTVIERVAEAIEGPPLALRSPAVALLELARRRVPLDAGLRAVYRERWRTGTRWAALRADEASGGGWTWIEPRPAADERVAGARALWRWPIGKPQVLRIAAPSAGHTALLRMYADVPGRAGAIGMHVGEHKWLAPVLGRVEPWQVALPPGRHPVTMTAPAGATVWSSRAPGEGPPDGHLLRMWPAGPGETVRFVLPAGEEPAFVRVEVRAIGDGDSEGDAKEKHVRVWIARDDAPAQAVDLRLPAVDPAVVPVLAHQGLGGRAVVVVRVEAGVTALTVRVAGDGPRVAIAAAVRATRAKVAAEGLAAGTGEMVEETGEGAGAEGEAGLAAGTGETGAVDAGTGENGLAEGTGGTGAKDGLAAGTGGKGGKVGAGRGGKKDGGAVVAGEADGGTTEGIEAVAFGVGGVIARDDQAALARLEALSQALQADPRDSAVRLARAELLLDLDQPGYAYVDWQVVTAGGLPRDLIKPAMALADRLDALDAPDAIDLTTSDPVVVAPAVAAAIGGEVARLNAVEPAVAAARTGGAEAGIRALDRLGLDPGAGSSDRSGEAGASDRSGAAAAAVLRAGWLDQRGEADAAARVWAGLEAKYGLWQAGLMGVHSFLAALDGAWARPGALMRPQSSEPRAEGAALAYGLALSVRRTVRTPAVQRLVTVAATRSKWSRVASSERDAGVESLTVPRAPALPSPNAAVRQALVIPPWPHAEATLLRPGYATVLALQREASELAVDVWCEEVRPGAGTKDAEMRVTLDGVDLLRGPVAARAVAGPRASGLPAGRHRVEVELDGASRGHLCSVRLRDKVGAVGSVRPTTWRVARPGQPVEVVVLGPTTMAIEGRALLGGGDGARGLTVAAARGRGLLRTRASLILPIVLDPLAVPEAERTIHPGVAVTRVIALPDSGAHRVVISTTRGAALVRLQQRLDGEAVALPRPPVRSLDLGGIVDEVGPIALPAATLPAVATAPRAVQRFGTTTAEVHVGTDDLDGADDQAQRVTSSVRLGWARELLARRMWLQVAPVLRPREGTPMTGGGELALQVLFPRAGLRTRAAGEVLGSRGLGEAAWSVRGALRIDRPTWIGRRLQLLPSAELALRGQSLGPAALVASDPIHPRIYTKYAATHPIALRPGLELRWQRWQDARVYAATDVVINSDFKGLDQWNLRGGMVGVMAVLQRVVPEFAAEYEASVRMRDQFRGLTYVQHRVRAGVGFGVWVRRSARVVFGVSDSLFASTALGVRNVLDVWLRIDLVLGRGLRDFGPLDMAFRPVREPRLWLGGEGAP